MGSALLETAEFYVKKSGVLLPMLGEDFRLAQLDAPALDAYVRARRDEGTRDHDVVILPRVPRAVAWVSCAASLP